MCDGGLFLQALVNVNSVPRGRENPNHNSRCCCCCCFAALIGHRHRNAETQSAATNCHNSENYMGVSVRNRKPSASSLSRWPRLCIVTQRNDCCCNDVIFSATCSMSTYTRYMTWGSRQAAAVHSNRRWNDYIERLMDKDWTSDRVLYHYRRIWRKSKDDNVGQLYIKSLTGYAKHNRSKSTNNK